MKPKNAHSHQMIEPSPLVFGKPGRQTNARILRDSECAQTVRIAEPQSLQMVNRFIQYTNTFLAKFFTLYFLF